MKICGCWNQLGLCLALPPRSGEYFLDQQAPGLLELTSNSSVQLPKSIKHRSKIFLNSFI
eukprot:3329789-Amphidinium_carterae.1